MTPEEMIAARMSRNLTQDELAALISKRIFKGKKKISLHAISKMERGTNPVAWYVEDFFEKTL